MFFSGRHQQLVRFRGGGRRDHRRSTSTHERPRPNPARSNLMPRARSRSHYVGGPAIAGIDGRARHGTDRRNRRRCDSASTGGSKGPRRCFWCRLIGATTSTKALDVTIDDAANGCLEPITRVASGSHDMALADINAVIRFATRIPSAPVRAVFMVYNRPPYAIVGRKSRGISDPKSLEGKQLGAPPVDRDHPAMADVRQAERDRRRAR